MITIKSKKQLALMAEAGKIVAETLCLIKENIKPGITTEELNLIADKNIRKNGAEPSFLNYNGFPGSACISINEEVIHGIPGARELKPGDLVSVDLGAKKAGYHGDAARTFAVGEIKPEERQLLETTQTSLNNAIEKAVIDNRLGDISSAVEKTAMAMNFGIVRDYTGHGIGEKLHEEPSIPNYGKAGRGVRLTEGMTLAIEPMLNLGSDDVKSLEDGWTVVTADGRKSAHFENTIAITTKGPVILTEIN